jgi:hypothetical protein
VRWTLVAAAVVGVLMLIQDGRGSQSDARPTLTLVDGSLSLQNSLAGQAVFSAEDMAPGDSTKGSVTVSNAGTLAGDLTLSEGALSDTPGPGGQPLSQRLWLVVRDVTSGSPTTMYDGRLDGLGPLSLGTLSPGAVRVFEFTTSLPVAAEDDSVAGASMSVSYTWTAEETTPPVEPPPPPPGPPPPPPGPPPPPDSTDALKQPLRVRVRVPRRQPLFSRGQLIAYVRCDQTCWLDGEARLAAGRGRRVRTRHVRSGRVRPGREKRLALRLPKRSLRTAKRALGKRRRASVKVIVRGRTAAGARRTVEKRATIRLR